MSKRTVCEFLYNIPARNSRFLALYNNEQTIRQQMSKASEDSTKLKETIRCKGCGSLISITVSEVSLDIRRPKEELPA
jgi:hypothetical protein